MNQTTNRSVVGIDVSKATLDVAWSVDGPHAQYPNSRRGLTSLTNDLLKRQPSLVICEPTGGYEQSLVNKLNDLDVKVRMVDPARAHYLKKAFGQRAKTDKIDAAMLARFGTMIDGNDPILLSPEARQLHPLVQRREQLTDDLVRERGRLESACSSIKAEVKRSIAALQKKIKALEARMQKLINADPELKRKSEILKSAHGVGPIVSVTLLTSMPELGQLGRKQIAALAGLAPWPYESGQMKGKRHIRGGRSGVRRVLYMAAIQATRGGFLRGHYRKLTLEECKESKVALIACARKLLVVLNSMIRNNKEWVPDHQPTWS